VPEVHVGEAETGRECTIAAIVMTIATTPAISPRVIDDVTIDVSPGRG
jgi:hypothetical protein